YRRVEPLAREPRADEEKQRVARPATELGARGAAQRLGEARVEMLQVDAAVDHVQLLRCDAEGALDLVANHARIADHRAQAGVLEHALFRAADVAVVWIHP